MAKENEEEWDEQNKDENQEKGKMRKMLDNPVYRTVAGGALGAGIGYALNPKTGQKVLSVAGLDEDEKNCGDSIKDKAIDWKDSALGFKESGIQKSQKVAKSLKDKVSNNNDGNEDSQKEVDTQYQSLKSENEELQERLQQLEDKLDKFSKSKTKRAK
ncbi:hypothetical protein ACWKSJ_13915 (plasmid) [Staphylococcus equorum]